ncbi:MAG: hypothetical protein JNM66_10080 [Bryobacterales bacterium]|nr:hypothetical protein [Bryobacterales bacterium]
MPGFLMHAGATIQCPHAVPAQIVPTQARVLVNAMPVALISDQIIATGCPFTVPPGKPQPCVLAKWFMPSTRVLINGTPAMVLTAPGPGPGLFQSADQIPAGPPIVTVVQTRVTGM